LAGKTRRRAVRAPGKKARLSRSRAGTEAAYCAESRRRHLSEAADNAIPRMRITSMRVVKSGSSAFVASGHDQPFVPFLKCGRSRQWRFRMPYPRNRPPPNRGLCGGCGAQAFLRRLESRPGEAEADKGDRRGFWTTLGPRTTRCV
jgi:hypothetical protein